VLSKKVQGEKVMTFFVSLLACTLLVVSGCSVEQSDSSTIGETTINRFSEERNYDIPFENVEILRSFSDDSQLLDYDTARTVND
jgi:hypothetical protein